MTESGHGAYHQEEHPSRHLGHRWQDGPPKEEFDYNAYVYFSVFLPDGRRVLTHGAYFFDPSLAHALKEMSLMLDSWSKKEEYNRTLVEVANEPR